MSRPTVPADGPLNAKLAVVGMAPAKEEIIEGRPFVGPSGRLLNSALNNAGLSRENVFVTNLVDFPILTGGSVFNIPRAELDTQYRRLHDELTKVKPNCVLLCGAEPISVLTGKSGAQDWRGSILQSHFIPGLKCVATVHPAWLLRGMFKWVPVFRSVDIPRAIEESAYPEVRLPKREAITGPSLRTTLDYIEECQTKEYLSFDIETAYWSKGKIGEIACVGIGYREDQALCIPFMRASGNPYWTSNEEARVWQSLAQLLQNHNIKKIGQNFSFDWLYFWKHKVYPANPFIDTMLLHHCLYPDFGGTENWTGQKKGQEGVPGHSLAFINSCYTKSPYYKDDGKLWKPEMGEHQLWIYNCMDVMVTFDCAMQMMKEAKEEINPETGVSLWTTFQHLYMGPFLAALRMEWSGVMIDIPLREEASKQLRARASELQSMIDDAIGYPLNPNSSKQMLNFLYTKRNYQIRRNRKTGRATADKEALQYFADKYQDPVLLHLLEKRQVEDLIGDVVEQSLGDDNCMHSHFKQGGTDGTRWSSTRSVMGTGTNLQNIPRKGIARRLFIPS